MPKTRTLEFRYTILCVLIQISFSFPASIYIWFGPTYFKNAFFELFKTMNEEVKFGTPLNQKFGKTVVAKDLGVPGGYKPGRYVLQIIRN